MPASLAYANALSGPFVLDDQDTIVLNEQIRQLSPSVVLFPAVELPVAGRPAVNVSFALNYAFGGLDVRGYHVVNVAIHIACALLLFGIVRRTLGLPALRDRFAARSADLAVRRRPHLDGPSAADRCGRLRHAANRADARPVLSADALREHPVGPAAGAAGSRQWKPDSTDDSTGWLVVAVISCVLGMASKESMVTAPFMVLVYDRVFVFDTLKEAWRRRWPFYVSLAATWIVLAALIWSGPRFRSAGFSAGVSPWTYLLNQARMIVRYLRLAVWPSGLVVDYGVPRALTVGDVAPYGALVLTLAALDGLGARPDADGRIPRPLVLHDALADVERRADRDGSGRRAANVSCRSRRSWSWPSSGLRGCWSDGLEAGARFDEATAGRSDGPCAHRAGVVVLAVVVIALAAGTWSRNREYASAVSLARTTLERWPNPRARHSLGVALLAEGQREAGITELRQAVSDDPAAHYTLGVALFQDGKLDEAVQHLREFLARESLRIEVPVAHELVGAHLEDAGTVRGSRGGVPAGAAHDAVQDRRARPSCRDPVQAAEVRRSDRPLSAVPRLPAGRRRAPMSSWESRTRRSAAPTKRSRSSGGS